MGIGLATGVVAVSITRNRSTDASIERGGDDCAAGETLDAHSTGEKAESVCESGGVGRGAMSAEQELERRVLGLGVIVTGKDFRSSIPKASARPFARLPNIGTG